MGLTINKWTEEGLLRACRKGDASAQRQLYELYAPRMYALCFRYVRDPMEAEDILVTSFTKIFERIDQFKGEGSLEGWIRRIMVNESLTSLRRNKSMYLETDIAQADQEPDYTQLGHQLEADDLLQMIQQLPPGYRIVFNLYAIDGYSHKEIAEQLGINENTSKSQLSRARVYLQKMLLLSEKGTTQKMNDHEATR